MSEQTIANAPWHSNTISVRNITDLTHLNPANVITSFSTASYLCVSFFRLLVAYYEGDTLVWAWYTACVYGGQCVNVLEIWITGMVSTQIPDDNE